MQLNITSLIGYKIGATDGVIGSVEEFYFDDQSYTIRYLVVKTGSWLFGRKVLISPQSVLSSSWEDRAIPVSLTMDQVKHSPDIDTDKPVSRQHEIQLHEYYPWLTYWGSGSMLYPGSDTLAGNSTLLPVGAEPGEQEKSGLSTPADPHLRSTDEMTGYRMNAADGEIGYVDDFVIGEREWTIDFLVIDTRKWLTGTKVLIAPKWIKEINWEDSLVMVDLSVERVKTSPEFEHYTIGENRK
jgi:hypothetical protein